MTRAELLARIRKCLALAKSANEHEAAAALAKARQLIDEHGLDQADVDAIDVGEARAKGGGAWTPTKWERTLATSVKRAIPVELIAVGDSDQGRGVNLRHGVSGREQPLQLEGGR